MSDTQLPQLLVSACLDGQPVRYDGLGRESGIVSRVLAKHFRLLPVCPEVGAGLGVPRPPVELVGSDGRERVLGVSDRGLDVTSPLGRYSEETAACGEFSGCLLKARSPSCGLDIPLHDFQGGEIGRSRGLLVQALIDRDPDLPLADEEDLEDPERGGRFLFRILLYELTRRPREGAALEQAAAHAQALFTDWGRMVGLEEAGIGDLAGRFVRAAGDASGLASAFRSLVR